MSLLKLLLFIGAPGIGLAAVSAGSIMAFSPVVIESVESQNLAGEPVFNRIQLVTEGDKDIWLMRQSHNGPRLPAHDWDSLAIVVDKSKSPKEATFYQLAPGAGERPDFSKHAPMRASCFMCHSNGPRAIRPQFDSELAPLGLKEQSQLALWNLKIKLYGRIVESAEQASVVVDGGAPFKLEGKFENEALTVKTCVKCHNESGFLARGPLKRQHFMAIKFMVENAHMPPPGFGLDPKESEQIENFVLGLW
jgi:hypothetical protein